MQVPIREQSNPYTRVMVFFYCWILLEGIIRKWVAPGLATPVFFLKYVIMMGVFVYMISHDEKLSLRAFPFIGFLLFFVFYALLEQINLSVTPSPLVGIIGMIVYLGFVPLCFILPKVITKVGQLSKILDWVTYISLPIFVLGVIQYFSPPSSIINKYVSEDMDIAMVGNYVRITTIFSYIAGQTTYCGFVLPLLFIRLLVGFKLNRQGVLTIVVFMLGIVNTLMTGSRTAVFSFIINATLLLLGIMLGFGGKGNKIGSLIPKLLIVVGISIAGLLQTTAGQEAFAAFTGRMDANNDVGGRVIDSLSPFKFLDQSGLIGYGIGTTYEANAGYLTGRARMPDYWEEESERIVIELGLVGFIVLATLRLSIFFFAVRTLFQVTFSPGREIVLLIVIYNLYAILFFNVIVFNWLENVFYWTEVGLLVVLRQMQQRMLTEEPDRLLKV